MHILLSYSLVKKAANGGIYSLHPLVHCWCHDSMSHEEQQFSSFVATLLASFITFDFNAKDYTFRQALIPHIKALGKCNEELGIQGSYGHKLYTNFSLAYVEAGYWKEAEGMQAPAMQASWKDLGEEHPDTLSSMGNLAVTYWNQGRWREAEELEIQVMQMRKRILRMEP